MTRKRKIVSMFSVVLMSTLVLTACGKVTIPVLLIMDPDKTNTMTLKLPAGDVTSTLVGNTDTSVVLDTGKLMSANGVPATVAVNAFAAAGTSIPIYGINSGTLCISLQDGATAGGIAYLRPFIAQTAEFHLTLPTKTLSVDKGIRDQIGPILLTLPIDAAVKSGLSDLLNLVLKGTGLNITQNLNLTIPAEVPLIGGVAVNIVLNLKSQKTRQTDTKLNACIDAFTCVCGDGKVRCDEQCDDGNTVGGDGCSATCMHENVCGDGAVSGTEKCDTALIEGVDEGACPMSCTAPDACSTSTLTGTDCHAECVVAAITTCATGDGCCPAGCNFTNDCDCGTICGNGVVESGCGEECDPPDGITCDFSCSIIVVINKCSPGCSEGQVCTSFVGKGGFQLNQCVIPCGADKSCPDGLTCYDYIIDGPQIPTCM
jgi:cysteine-rich repeat protein